MNVEVTVEELENLRMIMRDHYLRRMGLLETADIIICKNKDQETDG